MKYDPLVIVQACDGRWNYCPRSQEQLARSDEFGTYPTQWDARDAMLAEVSALFKEASK